MIESSGGALGYLVRKKYERLLETFRNPGLVLNPGLVGLKKPKNQTKTRIQKFPSDVFWSGRVLHLPAQELYF